MRYIISVLVLCICVNSANAQEVYSSSGRKHAKRAQEGFDPSKLVFGGGLIAGFGNGYSNFGLSPIIGYKITDDFTAGLGLGYQYLKTQITVYDQNLGIYINNPIEANIVTPCLWSRYNVWNQFFAEGIFEYSMQWYDQYYYDNNGNISSGKYHVNVPCLLMGVGIKQPLGGNASIMMEILYDVLQDKNSPYYKQPVFRGGIGVGF